MLIIGVLNRVAEGAVGADPDGSIVFPGGLTENEP